MSSPLTPVLVVGIVAWSLYRRVRRSVGRQPLRPRRIGISIGVFILAVAVFFVASLAHLPTLLGLLGGLLAGVILGVFGLHLTRFESTADGHFYTPNTHIGIALTALFLVRVGYRMWVLRDFAAASNHPPPFQSPLTSLIFGLLFGYYLTYYIGLFAHTRAKAPGA